MNHQHPVMTQTGGEQPNSWPMIRALAGIGILCSLLIVSTWQLTLPTITKKKNEYLEKAIYQVLPGATSKKTFLVREDGTIEPMVEEVRGAQRVFAGYDDRGTLVGLAIEARGQGFQDVLKILYGYSPEKQAIIGMRVLESKETPGLGDKIEKDPDFLANFVELDVSVDENAQIRNPIVSVKRGTKSNPWEIDSITGATISSKAVANILRENTLRLIPVVMKNMSIFEQGGESEKTQIK